MAFLYRILFPPTCRYPNNEHENDFANGQGFDFEKVVYVGEFSNEEDMENDDLPPDLMRLVEQEERQILPHQETTEVVNLGTEKEKKGEDRDYVIICYQKRVDRPASRLQRCVCMVIPRYARPRH